MCRFACGGTPRMVQACRMGSGCGFLFAVVSPETLTTKKSARPGALQQRPGEGRGLVGDHARRQAERGRPPVRHVRQDIQSPRPLKPA